MHADRWQSLKELFHSALQRATVDRPMFVAQACAGQASLAVEVNSLLASHRQASRFIEEPVLDAVVHRSQAAPTERTLREQVGRYELIRLIASGGMGDVYEAWQPTPSRRVALKVMKPGAAPCSALRRFEFESQLLARLRHPGIAQVYEAGTHDDGSGSVPYFAMEYIPNALSITEFATAQMLTLRQRLQMIIQVCDAVQHGHQRGIIHRDLKPSNILVEASGPSNAALGAEPSHEPCPKIIDFGVARVTCADLAIPTLNTNPGQIIGTLQYMSPEQCGPDAHDLDTRSDVYAMGVVLYELLCERLPYDVSELPIYEAVRLIREQPPSRPTTIKRELRGDLQTIMLKALEKDRNRRYQSAAELSDDLRRYLECQPVLARPPSLTYHLRMFASRNKGRFAATVALLAVMLSGVLGVTGQAIRATRAEAQALTERHQAMAVNAFLHDMLSAATPEESLGQTVTAREILDRAAQEIGGQFTDQPLVEAAVRHTIGSSYRSLGLFDQAQAHLAWALETRQRILSDLDPRTLDSLNNLAGLRRQQGLLEEAQTMFHRVLEGRRRALGSEHSDTLISMNNLANIFKARGRLEEAEALFRQTLEVRRRVSGDDDRETLTLMHNLAQTLRRLGRLDEAETMTRQAVAGRRRVLGEGHPNTITSMGDLAGLLRERNKLEEAEPLFLRVCQARERTCGPEHPSTLTSLNNLATLLRDQRKLGEAETLYRRVLETRQRVSGADHPSTLTVMHNLANVLAAQGKLDEAEPLCRLALESRRRALGVEHTETLLSMHEFAGLLRQQGELDLAESQSRQILEIANRALPPDHWLLAVFHGSLGRTLALQRRYSEAEVELMTSHVRLKTALGQDHQRTLTSVGALIELYEAWNKPEKAKEFRAMASHS